MTEGEDGGDYSAEQFQMDIRWLIDRAIDNGVHYEDVERILQYHLDGTRYYYGDALRYDYVDEI